MYFNAVLANGKRNIAEIILERLHDKLCIQCVCCQRMEASVPDTKIITRAMNFVYHSSSCDSRLLMFGRNRFSDIYIYH